MKTCSRCRESKSESEFPKDKRRHDGLYVYCKKCTNAAHKYKYQALPKTPEVKAQWREMAVRWRARMKECGRCMTCGKNPAVNSGRRCRPCQEIENARMSEYKQRLKAECFAAYGGPRCACCGETIEQFLSIDHVDNNGAEHRRTVFKGKCKVGTLWVWLKKNNFPPGFQVLCMNCNFGKARNDGRCPHEDEPDRHPVDKILAKFGDVRPVQ